MDHKQIHFVLKHVVKEKWSYNPLLLRYINWKDYRRANLEVILKKAPSRFHTLDNL